MVPKMKNEEVNCITSVHFFFLLSTYMLLFICKQGVRESTAHLSPEHYFCLVFILTGFDLLYIMKKEIAST